MQTHPLDTRRCIWDELWAVAILFIFTYFDTAITGFLHISQRKGTKLSNMESLHVVHEDIDGSWYKLRKVQRVFYNGTRSNQFNSGSFDRFLEKNRGIRVLKASGKEKWIVLDDLVMNLMSWESSDNNFTQFITSMAEFVANRHAYSKTAKKLEYHQAASAALVGMVSFSLLG